MLTLMTRVLASVVAICAVASAHEEQLSAPTRRLLQSGGSGALPFPFSIIHGVRDKMQSYYIAADQVDAEAIQSGGESGGHLQNAKQYQENSAACKLIGAYPAIEGEWAIRGAVRRGSTPAAVENSDFSARLQIGNQDGSGMFDAIFSYRIDSGEITPLSPQDIESESELKAFGGSTPALFLCAIAAPSVREMRSSAGGISRQFGGSQKLQAKCSPVVSGDTESDDRGPAGPSTISLDFVSPGALCPCTKSTVDGIFTFEQGSVPGIAKVTGDLILPYLVEEGIAADAAAAVTEEPDDTTLLTPVVGAGSDTGPAETGGFGDEIVAAEIEISEQGNFAPTKNEGGSTLMSGTVIIGDQPLLDDTVTGGSLSPLQREIASFDRDGPSFGASPDITGVTASTSEKPYRDGVRAFSKADSLNLEMP